MAGPAAVIVAGFFTMALAFRTEDGLVADDYYRQGLAINRELGRERRARDLGLSALIGFAGGRVRATLAGDGPAPAELQLKIIHPTRADRDRSIVLHAVGPGVYEGSFAPPDGEARLLVLEDRQSTWRLEATWNGRSASASLAAER
jgi:hypothetical protein